MRTNLYAITEVAQKVFTCSSKKVDYSTLRNVLRSCEPICWESWRGYLFFWGNPDKLPTSYFDLSQIKEIEFDKLNGKIQSRLLYLLVSKGLKNLGFYFDTRYKVYLPESKDLEGQSPIILSRRMEGQPYWVHEAFVFNFQRLAGSYFFVLRPSLVITKDGRTERLDRQEKDKLLGWILRHSGNRYAGQSRQRIDYWIDYLARATPGKKIKFNLPDLPTNVGIDSQEVVLRSENGD